MLVPGQQPGAKDQEPSAPSPTTPPRAEASVSPPTRISRASPQTSPNAEVPGDARTAEQVRPPRGFLGYWRQTSFTEKLITFGGGYLAARFLLAGSYGVGLAVMAAAILGATMVGVAQEKSRKKPD